MNVRTKRTYRAALDGTDLSMDKILSDLGYDPSNTKPAVELYRQPTNVRLEAAKKRLETFATNKEVGLVDYVKYARNVMHDFLDVIKLGHLHDLYMDNSGLLRVEIACMLHPSGLENNASSKAKFDGQLAYLDNMGLEVEKAKGFSHYRLRDCDKHRTIIRDTLNKRGAKLIRMDACKDEIDRISFILDPKDMCNFTENPTDYTLPVTDELNEDEMIKMKKLVNEIPSSLAFIQESPEMLQTCGCLAESYFSDICETVGFEGIVSKRVRERHAHERAANMNIHEIEKKIGEKFPAEIARNVMEKISATMAYFCIENLHATTRDLIIDEWGTVKMNVKISQRSDDLRYYYCFDESKYNEPPILDEKLIGDVFDVVKNTNGGIRLKDTENNRNTIAAFVKSVCGFEIDSISIVRDNCYVTKTRYGEEVTNLENVFVIDQISVYTDSIEGILRQHDLCRMRKDV